ncbi:MAG: glycosyltransferase [Pseudomonadota bacterium]
MNYPATEPTRFDNLRVLIYSHDTFGLGHLRRCRAIAHELVGRYKGISVLILSGSPVIGGFEFRARVDFVRIPGVIKLKDGRYTSLGLHIDLDQTMAIREAIIRQTAEVFEPDLFIVDKEPLGLKGEVKETLRLLRDKGVKTVLGERDVIDDSGALRQEWGLKAAVPALKDLYDEIWIYGTREFYDPFHGLGLESEIYDKTIFTGYLRRPPAPDAAHIPEKPYVLVTPGGGKDGEEVVDLVFDCYRQTNKPDINAVFVLGPFMGEDSREAFKAKAESIDEFTVLDFHPRMESLIEHASGMVTMGGYNTFCEILSFDQPAIVVPRYQPRMEQLIRARRATEMGLIQMLEPDEFNVSGLLPKLREISAQPRPSSRMSSDMLSGMDVVCDRVVSLVTQKSASGSGPVLVHPQSN